MLNNNKSSTFDDSFKFIHIEVLGVAQTRWAICLITVNTKEAVLVGRQGSGAPHAFARLVGLIRDNHTLTSCVLFALLEHENTFIPLTQSKAFLGPSKSHQLVG